MKKFRFVLLCVMSVCCLALAACGKQKNPQPVPTLLKDGDAVSLTVGECQTIDLTEYISLNGLQKPFEATSSQPTVASAEVESNTLTIVALSSGSTTIHVQAADVGTDFSVTVTAPAVIEKPAPTFESVVIAYDLKDKTEVSVTLAPQTGDASYMYTYSVVPTNKHVAIHEDTLTVSFDEETVFEAQIEAAYTDGGDNTGAVSFALTVTVSDSREPVVQPVPTFADRTVSYDLLLEKSKTLTLVPETSPEGFEIEYALKEENEHVSIENDIMTVSYSEATKIIVTVVASFTGPQTGSSEFNVTITVTDTRVVVPTLGELSVSRAVDLWENGGYQIELDFSENIVNPDNVELTYTVTKDGEPVGDVRNGGVYTYTADGSYEETSVTTVFHVKVDFTANQIVSTLEYDFTLSISDTTTYRVKNGTFDADLDGWSLSGEIGAISEQPTWWEQQYPMFNVGKYFSGYGGDGLESNTGTLTSSEFTVGGQNTISFLLGGAGNKMCYITIETASGDVIAVLRNAHFADFTETEADDEERRDAIGKTVFLANLVPYTFDLTEHRGQRMKVVLHDEGINNWGLFFFDQLITYYPIGAPLPSGAIVAVNELADKTSLEEALSDEITEQGDYTQESYDEYRRAYEAAKAVAEKPASVMQEEVDKAATALRDAKTALAVRKPIELSHADKEIRLGAGKVRTFDLTEYVDENALSDITYDVTTADELYITIDTAALERKQFTVTAQDTEGQANVTITVKYKGTSVLSLTISITVTQENKPTVKNQTVERSIDLYTAGIKTAYTFDLSENIDNPGELPLTYSAEKDGRPVELADECRFVYSFEGPYTEDGTDVELSVTVSFNDVETIEYMYILHIIDTTSYRIENGDFETGDIEGWTISGHIGAIDNKPRYWEQDAVHPEGFLFGMDGSYMFSAYADGIPESARGTLTSGTFVLGGSGWITFKIGAMKNADKEFVDVVEADTGKILARFYNRNWTDTRESDATTGCSLIAYKADLSAHKGKTVFLRFCDNGVSDYGLFFLDSVMTYYPSAPDESFAEAIPVADHVPGTIYELYNGGFETGDLTGWTYSSANGSDFGRVEDESYYWNDPGKSFGKPAESSFLFTGVETADANQEGGKGTLTSSIFTLKQNGTITFYLGGAHNVLTEMRIMACDGTILAVFNNQGKGNDAALDHYRYTFTGMGSDLDCYIEFIDDADSGWGLFVIDEIVTNAIGGDGEEIAPVYAKGQTQLFNGGFDKGDEGWLLVTTHESDVEDQKGAFSSIDLTSGEAMWGGNGSEIPAVSYNNDGAFLKNGAEASKGYALSAMFEVSENGWITFKLGGNKANSHIAVIDAITGEELCSFVNEDFAGAWPTQGWEMHAYKANLSECGLAVGRLVRIKLVDDAENDYGVIVADSIITYYAEEPQDGFVKVENRLVA